MSVRNHRVAHGVSAQRVAADGRGAGEPIASNSSEAGRARNRRVDIFVGETAGLCLRLAHHLDGLPRARRGDAAVGAVQKRQLRFGLHGQRR